MVNVLGIRRNDVGLDQDFASRLFPQFFNPFPYELPYESLVVFFAFPYNDLTLAHFARSLLE
jgi:hypothetical protein